MDSIQLSRAKGSLQARYLKYGRESGLAWNFELPVVRAVQINNFLFNRYGITYDAVDMKPQGRMVWQDPPSKVSASQRYNQIVIRDMALVHQQPAPHVDFLFLTVKMDVPEDKASQLAMITTSVQYYPLGKLLTAACHRLQASLATFVVVKLFATDKIMLSQAQELYGALIMLLFNEFDNVNEDLSQPTPKYDLCERYVFDLVSMEAIRPLIKEAIEMKHRNQMPMTN